MPLQCCVLRVVVIWSLSKMGQSQIGDVQPLCLRILHSEQSSNRSLQVERVSLIGGQSGSVTLPSPCPWFMNLVQTRSLICTSCCILVIASVMLCGPSAGALTLRQFCPRIKRRKRHFPNYPKICLASGRFSLLLLSFSFLPSFTIIIKRLMDELLALVPPIPFLYFILFPFFSSFFFLFFHFPSFRLSRTRHLST